MAPRHKLAALGQSVWYENSRRALLDSGELESHLDRDAVTGVTSDPTIFEQAIAEGGDSSASGPSSWPSTPPPSAP